MTEKNAEVFISKLKVEIFRQLEMLYESATKTTRDQRVTMDARYPTSIALEKQQRWAKGRSQPEQELPVKLETHIYLDHLSGELDIWHSDDALFANGESNAQFGDGTKVERFQVLGDDPALAGYKVSKAGKTLYLDGLVTHILKPIFDAPNTI
jgi:hypothetical protein